MFSIGKISILAVLLLSLGTALFAVVFSTVDEAISYTPALQVASFDEQNTSATSYVVFDVETGTEIASKNETDVHAIASITKLITAGVFLENTDLTSSTSIQWSDVNAEGDAGKLKVRDVYTHRELLYPLLLESSNDASETMVRVYPKLVTDMNSYAASLGLSKTVFADASGLSDKNVSTAYELFVLVKALKTDFPHVFDITSLSQFIGTHTGWLNNNPLINEQGYVGGKHGYTHEANRTLIAFFDESFENGQVRTVGYILLGSDNLKEDIKLLREEMNKKVSVE